MGIRPTIRRIAIACGAALIASAAIAAPLPSAIDPGRVDRKPELQPLAPPPGVTLPKLKVEQNTQAPAGSNKINFTLHSVMFEGMHAFTETQVADIYQPYIGKQITLDMVWLIAGKLTERYQAQGYFLSRVYVPAQEVEGGDIKLHVVEGYISEVNFEDDIKDKSVVHALTDGIMNERPATARGLESALLRLNDLPGVAVRAVLALPDDKDAPEGATVLNLVRVPKPNAGKISVDNDGSRYLGPYEVSAQYEAELIPLERTSVSLLGATQLDELKYASLHHEIPLFPGATLEGYVTYTHADPGYTLEIQDIRSKSLDAGFDVNYQWIRQRDENLKTSLAFDSRDTRSTILGTPLTRDAVRALRASASYDRVDTWNGYNQFSVTLSQGIDGLGSSQQGDAFLSRAGAKPDFEKAEFLISRLQALGSEFNAFAALSGQVSNDTLFSSEQFGYGGQAFGRAYDSSEITGDQGVAGALELRYTGIDKMADFFTLVPYTFYDLGTVWNNNSALGADRTSGSSAGFGLRTNTDVGVATNVGLAFPLTKPEETPLYTHNGKAPRLILEASYAF